MAVLTASYLGLTTVGTDTPLWVVDILMLGIGMGLGASANTIILLLQSAVDFTRFGVASAAGTFFRNIGATTGTAVLLTVLFNRAQHAITAAYDTARNTPAFTAAAAEQPEQLATLHDGLARGLTDTSFLTHLDPALADPYLTGFTDAMHTVMLIAASLAATGLLLALALKNTPLWNAPAQKPEK
jgi:hypothetical protein